MTKKDFTAKAREFSTQAKAEKFDGYFQLHAPRLFHCCKLFELFSRPLGNVLEIGPFYGYIPLLLRKNASSYLVLEGPDPAVYPLGDVYQKEGINLSYVDFFDVFGPTQSAPHRLEIPDSHFDTILCWETMEHFNFNPVKFVRELHRVLKPGGQVCVTVPNKASLQTVTALFSGRGEEAMIDSYFKFENYESNGKKAFYGFHWREYSIPELRKLFLEAGFKVRTCGSFVTFQQHATVGIARKLSRILISAIARIAPRFGTHVYLVAKK